MFAHDGLLWGFRWVCGCNGAGQSKGARERLEAAESSPSSCVGVHEHFTVSEWRRKRHPNISCTPVPQILYSLQPKIMKNVISFFELICPQSGRNRICNVLKANMQRSNGGRGSGEQTHSMGLGFLAVLVDYTI